jgi:adenosylhomocysteine nucleosidase
VRQLSVGIVVALKVEAAALTTEPMKPDCLLPLANGAGVWLSGMGPAAARKAALALVEAGAQALATFGVAGALEGHLRAGVLICPRCIVDQHGHSYATDSIWRERLQQRLSAVGLAALVDVTLVSLANPLSTAADKRFAQNRYQAAAVDMESAAVAAVAASHDLPFIVLRAIVDELDDELPEALHAAIDPWGKPRWGPLFSTVLRRPSVLMRLPGLSTRMNKAFDALRNAAQATPDLEAPTAVRCTAAW